MTGHSHSFHPIKFIQCGAPQRDVLSDEMVLCVVTHSFYFMLCQSSLLSTVKALYTKTNGGDSYFYYMLCQSPLLSIVTSFAYKDKCVVR